MAKLFITDYASYNAGMQFVCGQWYDLNDYNDIDELKEAVKDHYITELQDDDNAANLKALNLETAKDFDLSDIELMITDHEDISSNNLSESFDDEEIENEFKCLKLVELLNTADDNTLIELHNIACRELEYSDDEIYAFDEDFFNTYFADKPMEAARATHFGDINWNDEFITFNGYGNLKSVRIVKDEIDKDRIIEAFLQNPDEFDFYIN